MEITSCTFLLAVAILFCIYWLVPTRAQWVVLLAASIGFYLLNSPLYTIVYILITWGTVYGAGILVSRPGTPHKKLILILTLLLNVGILAVLKYSNLFIDTLNLFRGNSAISHVNFVAPLAISFYMLQMISYLLDTYWGQNKAETNPFRLLLFMIFFPQMVSGPISRTSDLYPQLFEEHRFRYDRVANGLKRIAWGLVKKLLIAGKLAAVVDCIFLYPTEYNGLWVLFSCVLYLIELYADFSGCMDIVIGISSCLGITLTENFNAPFFSKSCKEFWNRWHITLGTWLRDYIMNPILKSRAMVALGEKTKKIFGKKQGKKIPSYIGMLAVWTCMGVWHGSNWKYVLGEGLWFWLVIVLGQILDPVWEKIKKTLHLKDQNPVLKAFQVVRTVLLLTVGFVFFKASSIRAGFTILGSIFTNRISLSLSLFVSTLKECGLYFDSIGGFIGLPLLLIGCVLMLIQEIIVYQGKDTITFLNKRSTPVRWLVYWYLVTSVCLTIFGSVSTFIYAGF